MTPVGGRKGEEESKESKEAGGEQGKERGAAGRCRREEGSGCHCETRQAEDGEPAKGSEQDEITAAAQCV